MLDMETCVSCRKAHYKSVFHESDISESVRQTFKKDGVVYCPYAKRVVSDPMGSLAKIKVTDSPPSTCPFALEHVMKADSKHESQS